MNAPDLDSVAFSVRGGFAGLNLDLTSQDSSWTLRASYREVDPFSEVQGRNPSVTTSRSSRARCVSHRGCRVGDRSASLFDLLTDVSRANQSLSPTLMAVAPLFDNICPLAMRPPTDVGRIGGGETAECIGHEVGSGDALGVDRSRHTQLRTFKALGLGAEWTSTTTSHPWRVSVFERLQQTQRGGSALEAIELLTSNLTMSAGFEVWPGTWLEGQGVMR